MPLERKRALESLIFLTEKRDGTVKGRLCANGSTQREYTDRDDTASPTAATESILVTGTIDAKQRRDVMTADIPNAFVQTDVGSQERFWVTNKLRWKTSCPKSCGIITSSSVKCRGTVLFH